MAARRAIDVLWFLVVAALGGTIAYLFAKHGGGQDETFTAYLGILVAASAVFGLMRPRWAWRWGLAVTLQLATPDHGESPRALD
jgi:alpha-beta hydrolase superfamily lysophospholipase